MDSATPDVIERLVAAMNDHDAAAVAACMTENYRSEAPTHPERSFTGRETVRENWAVAFENTPDLEADLLRATTSDDAVWTEWHIYGTQTDGGELDMRGTAIWGVEDDLLQWGRIYLDSVQRGDDLTWAEFYRGEELDESA